MRWVQSPLFIDIQGKLIRQLTKGEEVLDFKD